MTSPRRWVLALTATTSFMVALDALVVTSALPAIAHDLSAGVGALQWTVNAYALPCGVGIVPAAALGDRLGRRRVFVAGLALFTLASVGCALAPTVGWLLVARALQGAGAAAVLPLGLTILTGVYPAERRGAILGVWAGIGGLAVAAGPLVGGGLIEVWHWHGIFWLNLPIGVAAVVLSRRRLPESRGPVLPVDWPGVLLLAAAVGCCLGGLVAAGGAGPRTGAAGVLLGGGTALLAGFAAWERRARHPLLPTALLRTPGFAAAGLCALFSAAAVNGAVFLVPQFFQTALGVGPLATGVRVLPWTAAPLLIAPVAGAVADRVGRSRVLLAGLLAQGSGLGWLALVTQPGAGYGSLLPPLTLAGVGIALAVPAAASTALGRVSPAALGTASGTLNTLQRLGGALGVALAATMLASFGTSSTAEGFAAGVRPGLLTAAALSLVGAATAAGIATAARPALARTMVAEGR